jgi:GTPase-associated system helical domain
MTIHKDFADWYRMASVTPSAELLAARWAGVEAVAAALDAPQLIALLKVHAVRPQADYKTPDFLDSAFRASDTTFPSRNVEELRVLSGAILRQVIEMDGSWAISAALGLVSSAFGRRQTITNPDHIRAAELFLAQKAESVRASDVASSFDLKPIPRGRFDELLPTGPFAVNQTPTLREPLFTMLTEEGGRLRASLDRYAVGIWRVVQAQREELNMLWWLQTRVSRDLGIPFAQLSVKQAAIVLPCELADLTVFLPGPGAILGMILASLESTKSDGSPITVAAAVNSVTRSWREKLNEKVPATGVAEICPISFALAKSLDTDGEADWLPVYRKYCDVSIEADVATVEIAAQVYRERLFLESV